TPAGEPAVAAPRARKPRRGMPQRERDHDGDEGDGHGHRVYPASDSQRSISQRAIETGEDSTIPSSPASSPQSRASPARTSSRVNQRASSSSSSARGSSGSARAMKPSISAPGNGHGCEAR